MLEYKIKIIGNCDYCLFLYIYKLPRAKRLTKFEKGRIVKLSSSALSCRAIAKTIRRTKTVAHIFLQLSDNYGKINSRGRAKELLSRGKRGILRLASTGKYSGTEIIKQTGFNVCKKRFSTLLEGLAIFSMQ